MQAHARTFRRKSLRFARPAWRACTDTAQYACGRYGLGASLLPSCVPVGVVDRRSRPLHLERATPGHDISQSFTNGDSGRPHHGAERHAEAHPIASGRG